MKFSNLIINGKVYKDEYKQVSVLSPSFQYGLSVFEGIRGYLVNNEYNFFLLEEHLERLLLSAHLIGLTNLPDISDLINDIIKLKRDLSFSEDIYIKYILCFLETGGWSKRKSPDRVCFAYPLKSCFREISPFSTKARFSSINRISTNTLPPKIKCGANYINSRLAYLDVNSNKNQDDEIMPIMLDSDGYLTESSGSCIFIVKGNIVKTPPLYRSILNSLTRKFIIDNILKPNKEIKFFEESLDRWDLISAESVFLCGTNKEITLISSLNDNKYDLNNKITQYIFDSIKKKIFK